MSKVAVIGNTARAIGAVCASDLALSGHEVRYTVFPEQKDQLPEVRKAGGFTVEGDAKHLNSKRQVRVGVTFRLADSYLFSKTRRRCVTGSFGDASSQ